MATEVASAERQARAQASLNSHIERIAKSIGVAAPPPARADNKPAQNAAEYERLGTFMELVANYVDPSNATKYQQQPQALGGMGKYSELEEQAKAEQQRKQAQRPGEPVDVDTSPVSDSNADEAIESIGRMRSRDRLQSIADNDPRVTVKEAAKARLGELQ